MNRIMGLCFTLLVVVSSDAFATVPAKISYQGQYTVNGVLAEGDHIFTWRLYDSKENGTELWTDTDTLAVTDGVFHAYLGENAPLPVSVFTGAVLWLETDVDGTTIPGRVPLVSVAYSFRAAFADTAGFAVKGGGGVADTLWSSDATSVWTTKDVKVRNGTKDLVLQHDGSNAVLTTTPGSGSIWLNPDGPYLGIGGRTLRIQDASAGNSLRMLHDGTNAVITTTAGDIALDPATGRVGIETSDPQASLHVAGDVQILNTASRDALLTVRSESGHTVPVATFETGSNQPAAFILARSSSFSGTALEIAANRIRQSGYTFLDLIADYDGTPESVFKVAGNGNTTMTGDLAVQGNATVNDIYGNDAAGPMAIFAARTTSGPAFRIFTKGAGSVDKLRMGFTSGSDTAAVSFSNSNVTINGNLDVTGTISAASFDDDDWEGAGTTTLSTDKKVGIGVSSTSDLFTVQGARNNPDGNAAPLVRITNTGSGHGILVRTDGGSQPNTSALEAENLFTGASVCYGVKGVVNGQGSFDDNGSAVGVYGIAKYTGESTEGGTFGVLGRTHSFKNVDPQVSGAVPAGVFGEAVATSGIAWGMDAEVYSDHNLAAGIKAISRHSTGQGSAIIAENLSHNGKGILVKMPSSSDLGIWCDGRIEATGSITLAASKSYALTNKGGVETYGTLAAVPMVEDVGRAQLLNGVARVTLDPVYLETVTVSAEDPLFVQVQANGPTGSLWVELRDDGFTIHDPSGSSSSVTYFVKAKRRGMETLRLERLNPQFEQHLLSADQLQ